MNNKKWTHGGDKPWVCRSEWKRATGRHRGEDEGIDKENHNFTIIYERTFSGASKSVSRVFFISFSSSLSASEASAWGSSGLPINLGLIAKAPLGMKVERKMMTQATENCTLSRKRKHLQRLYEKIECLPSDGPERVQNILFLREVLVDNASKDWAEDGIHDDVTRVQESLRMGGKNMIFIECLQLTMTAPRAETFFWANWASERTDWM